MLAAAAVEDAAAAVAAGEAARVWGRLARPSQLALLAAVLLTAS